MELVALQSGTKLAHIPFKSSPEALNAVVSGETHMATLAPLAVLPQAKAGTIKMIAVSTPERWPAIPDVPTMAQAGFPGFEVVGWFAFFVHGQTPRPIAEKLHAALSEIIRSPDMAEFLKERGTLPTGVGLQEFARKVSEERRLWAKLIKENEIRLE
jgi:tripartite-type tricarboxylate transporter receptor subunit TctC